MQQDNIRQIITNETQRQLDNRLGKGVVTATLRNDLTLDITNNAESSQKFSIKPIYTMVDQAFQVRAGILTPEAAAKTIVDDYVKNYYAKWVAREAAKMELTKGSLRAHVIPADRNQALLKGVPHRKVEDLAVVPRYKVDENKYFYFTNDACEKMKLEPSEALQIAVQNTVRDGYTFENLSELMTRLNGGIKPEGVNTGPNVYVFSNSDSQFGAAGLFVSRDIRAEIRDRIEGDYYVLPSSIHELLIIKATEDIELKDLQQMVRSVNESTVLPKEQLSDEVYFVDKSLKIQIASSEKLDAIESEPVQMATASMSMGR